jgi:hypothetical protein
MRFALLKPILLYEKVLMMLTTRQTEHLYTAESVYQLRAFAKTRRYQVNEITAHTVTKQSACRNEVEAFIHAVFKVTYGANVTEFMPTLVALRDNNGVLMAAFGMRSAAQEKLFLEQYIDKPIEQLLSEKLGKSVGRHAITCIGNLAVSNPRNAGVLIAHIIQYSLNIGIEWCVATAHHSLQNGLIKGGRDVYPLHIADKQRLPINEQAAWGSYYNHLPQVIAIKGMADY